MGVPVVAFAAYSGTGKTTLIEKLVRELTARGVAVAAVHESPYRVTELVEVIAQTLPDTRISCSCDLTKLHEKTIRGTAEEVLAMLRANPKTEKGEYCLILDFHEVKLAEEKAPEAEGSLEAQLVEQLLQGLDLRDAQSELVLQGAKKNAVKQAALRLKKLFMEDEK